MAKHLTTTDELRKMSAEDLRADIREVQVSVAKLRLSVANQKEKDSAKYQREKKQLARMQTVLAELRQSGLSEPKKKVSSSRKSS